MKLYYNASECFPLLWAGLVEAVLLLLAPHLSVAHWPLAWERDVSTGSDGFFLLGYKTLQVKCLVDSVTSLESFQNLVCGSWFLLLLSLEPDHEAFVPHSAIMTLLEVNRYQLNVQWLLTRDSLSRCYIGSQPKLVICARRMHWGSEIISQTFGGSYICKTK